MRFSSDLRAVTIKNEDMLPLILTPADVAAILGISRNTAYELIHSKQFPVFSVGKQYRIETKKFLSWLDSASTNDEVA